MAKYQGWIVVELQYDFEAEGRVDAETKMKSTVNRVKNTTELIGTAEILDWEFNDAPTENGV